MATSNNDWLHIYQNNLAAGPPQPAAVRWPGDVTDATTVTTTAATASSVSDQLGRVTRPNNARRRTRASRRTPTTLLNTDTSNFRAMVQQFTGGNFCGGGGGGGGGGGSTAFMAAPAAGAPRQPLNSYNTNSSGYNYYGTGSSISPAVVGGYNMEFRQQPQHQHYYPIVADNGGAGGDHQHGFL